MTEPLDRPESTEHIPTENIDDALNEVRQLNESWHKRLTLDNPRLAERYLEGELIVVLEFRLLSGLGLNDKHYFAVYEREEPISGPEHNTGSRDRLISPRDLRPGMHSDRSMRGPYRNNQVVLVDVVELVKPPERFTPSSVWFERAQYADGPWRGSTYFSQTSGHKFLGGIADRESRVFVGGTATFDDELFGQVVETRPQVVEDVPEHHPPGQRDLFRDVDAEQLISCFRIELTDDEIRVGVQERADLAPKLVDVLFGPFNLQPDSGQRVTTLRCAHDEETYRPRRLDAGDGDGLRNPDPDEERRDGGLGEDRAEELTEGPLEEEALGTSPVAREIESPRASAEVRYRRHRTAAGTL